MVFDARGAVVARARRPVALERLDRARVEQSPADILASLDAVLEEVLAAPGIEPQRIHAAGLATQRSSVLAWERDTGRPLSAVLSWQDTRAAGTLAGLAEHAADIRRRSGLPLSPHYGATKLRWLLDHEPAVAAARSAGRLAAGPLAAFLLQHLLAGRASRVDHANASRTQLWNLETRDWDPVLAERFAVPPDILPECRPIRADYGRLRAADIPLTAVNGDQTAALHARGHPAAGIVRVNLGTGAFVLLPTGSDCRRDEALLTGLATSDRGSGSYYLEGTVNGAGAAMHWLEQRVDLGDWHARLPGWLDAGHAPPVFLNSIGGLGSPWWRAGPEPVFLADGAPVTPAADVAAVAVIESIVFLVQANLERLRARQPGIRGIRVSGGLARPDGLCRRLADLSGLAVERGTEVEATARGIAWLAAGCPDGWRQAEATTTFAPEENAALRARYATFLEALQA